MTASHASARIVHSQLNDGTQLILRPITANDRELLRGGIRDLSSESRYLRFFSAAPDVPEPVMDRLVDVDGVNHVAWGAICTDCAEPPYVMGAVHAVRNHEGSDRGEYSVAILDQFHNQGLARMLTAVLLFDCAKVGFAALDVFALSENRGAAALVKSMGAVLVGSDSGVNEYRMDVAKALAALRAETDVAGLAKVFRALDAE
jgi:ribosomal protein S18 acetylase RimI-like enzyme